MEHQRDEHRIRLTIYHLPFCPKRRKQVLADNTAEDCACLIRQKCADRGWELLQLAIQLDHVHLFLRVFPTTSAAEVVKEVTGLTAHELREKYPVLKKLPSLWTRSHFAATAGNVSEETIQRYIEAQKGG
jgi:REP-associated tyrosine transposase